MSLFEMPPPFPHAEIRAKLGLTDEKGVTTDFDVSVLRLQPGDILVFQTSSRLSMDAVARIKDYTETGLALKARDIRVMVLDDGMTLAGVLR